MRYAGRVKVNKVDSNGKKIPNLKKWLKSNPGGRFWDSKVEWEVWNYLMKEEPYVEFTEQVTLQLFDSVKTSEFTAPRKTKKAIKEGRTAKEIKNTVQHGIKYTPDFYLPKYDVYIEVKGYADELFKLRWKLFKIKGYTGYIVYSVSEFKELLEKLK